MKISRTILLLLGVVSAEEKLEATNVTSPQMKELLKTVDEIEEGTKNKGAATSIFDKIRDFFKKATQSSQPAQKK